MKRYRPVLLAVLALALIAAVRYSAEKPVKELSYAIYPYITDIPYYQELIEERWAETEPGIRLVRAEYNCYHDPDPKDTDVIMYDAFMLEDLIRNGWIQPIAKEDVQDAGDIYPFALDGLTADGKLYGIPVFLCGNFLVYDRSSEVLESAEHITDLSGEEELLLIGTGTRRSGSSITWRP